MQSVQVLAQAKYALELDSPVPLGFFLNEEVPEQLDVSVVLDLMEKVAQLAASSTIHRWCI